MFSRLLGKYEDIPIPSEKRAKTDILCCVITSLLALAMFVFALVTYIQMAPLHQLAYFTMPPHVVNPPAHNITAYDYHGFIWTLIITTVCCIGLGLFWLGIVQFRPMLMPVLAIVLAFLGAVTVAVFCFFVHIELFVHANWVRYVLAGIAIITAIVLLVYLIMFRNELKFQGLMLQYGTQFLMEKPINFIYIPIFLLLTAGLFALIMFQHISFSYLISWNNNLFDLSNPGIWGILNIIELLWGLRFLKDAFIFVISGQAVDWFWSGEFTIDHCLGLNNCMCFNWGSIAVGSFLRGIFGIPLLILELFICHPTGCCNSLGNCCYDNCCHNLIDLIRTDAYAYSNLFGKSYCDSCRECRHLCFQFTQFQGTQSPMRNYRIVAHLAIWFLCLIAGFAILVTRVLFVNTWFILELMLVISAVIEYFVSIAASAAEGLQVSIMVQNQFVGGYAGMKHCDDPIRRGIEDLTKNPKRDGSC